MSCANARGLGLSGLGHRRFRHQIAENVVDPAFVINVYSDPGAGDRFAGMVLLIEDVTAKDALFDLIELQLREIGSYFQIPGDPL